jgi:hypothetical protein
MLGERMTPGLAVFGAWSGSLNPRSFRGPTCLLCDGHRRYIGIHPGLSNHHQIGSPEYRLPLARLVTCLSRGNDVIHTVLL